MSDFSILELKELARQEVISQLREEYSEKGEHTSLKKLNDYLEMETKAKD